MAAIFVSFAYFIAGCATTEIAPSKKAESAPAGVYHKVRAGQTIWQIAKAYNVSVEDIVRMNNIPSAATIEKNQLIFVPGVKATKDIATSQEAGKPTEFDWPLKGKIISYFGDWRDTVNNRGVDIQTEIGEKVHAACDGRVVFADYLSGYGYMIILNHQDDFYTVYSQNSALLVKVDDFVSKGTPIAEVGENKGLALLHFEIRKNDTATNPLYYLP